MKTKEVDVYIQSTTYTDDRIDYLLSTKAFMGDLSVRATLILPAEPEVVETECAVNQGVVWLDKVTLNKLAGRRWHCTFREIV
jgi:hypothetical protein